MISSTQNQEEEILTLTREILEAETISDQEKKKYLNLLTEHGLTPKLSEELILLFEREEKKHESELEEMQSVLPDLKQISADESIDLEIAEKMAEGEEYGHQVVDHFRRSAEEIEQSIEKEAEQELTKAESSEQAVIRAKLGLKPENEQ